MLTGNYYVLKGQSYLTFKHFPPISKKKKFFQSMFIKLKLPWCYTNNINTLECFSLKCY